MTRGELVEIMERNLDSFMATDTDGCGYPIVSGDTIEKCADIIRTTVLVVQVICMFPYVKT